MKKITILSHQGLGDLILCNSIIRNYAKQYDQVYVIAPENNYRTISIMYKDLKNVEVVYIDWGEIHNIYTNDILFDNVLRKYNIYDSSIIKLGFINFQNSFDETFFIQANIAFEKKWSDFYLERNIEREKEVFYDILNLKDGDNYVFVHDDHIRGYHINEKYLNEKIIRPDNKDISIFDYLYTIEKAKEVHCMNSSFICLIDTMLLKNENIYYHRYVRGYNCDPTLKLKWKIID